MWLKHRRLLHIAEVTSNRANTELHEYYKSQIGYVSVHSDTMGNALNTIPMPYYRTHSNYPNRQK